MQEEEGERERERESMCVREKERARERAMGWAQVRRQTFAVGTMFNFLHEAAPCFEGSLSAFEGCTQAHTTAFAGTSSLPQI